MDIAKRNVLLSCSDESGALAIFHVGFTIYKPRGAKPKSSGFVILAYPSAKDAAFESTQVRPFATATARAAARQAAPKRAQNMTKIVKFSKKSQKILTFWRLPRWTTDTANVQNRVDNRRNPGGENLRGRNATWPAQAGKSPMRAQMCASRHCREIPAPLLKGGGEAQRRKPLAHTDRKIQVGRGAVARQNAIIDVFMYICFVIRPKWHRSVRGPLNQ